MPGPVETLAGAPAPALVEAAFAALALEGGRVLSVDPLDGGASNITCRVAMEGGSVVLRLQRERGIFEPYDVLREGEVLRCLHGSAVPVPRLLATSGDASLLGAPFIVMEWVDAPHMGVAGPEASFPAYVDSVVAIHAVDWRERGLSFLGVPVSPQAALLAELDAIERRLRRFVPGGDALLAAASAALRRDIPGDGEPSLCQGDINVFNYLFRAGEVVAVVDWEQARISDRRSDVGHLVALSHLKGAPFGPAGDMPFVRMYEAASGSPLGGMEWFRARWLWELGVIYHGWKSFNESDPWYSWPGLGGLLESAMAEL